VVENETGHKVFWRKQALASLTLQPDETRNCLEGEPQFPNPALALHHPHLYTLK